MERFNVALLGALIACALTLVTSQHQARKLYVPECVRLTADKVDEIDWLPTTCAYRLRGEGRPLYDWHYLISGDPESVHEAGVSVRGWTVPEQDAGDLEMFVIDREL